MRNEMTRAGPGVVRGGRARQHEDAGADDRADAQQHQCARVERAVQFVARLVGLVQFADGLGRKQAMRHGSCARCWGPVGQCRRTLPEPSAAG